MAARWWSRWWSRRGGATTAIGGQDPSDSDRVNAALVDRDGALFAKSILEEAGSGTGAAVGIDGRVPTSETFEIAAGKSIVLRPKQWGVTWKLASGGAAAVSVSGKEVTLTCKSDDSTTVTAMLALVAANASAAALLAVTGTGADTFDHTKAFSTAHELWATGKMPAQAVVVLQADGYWWPAEADATGGLKASLTSLINGEDSSRRVLRVEQQPTASAEISASAAIVAAGTPGRIYGVLASVTAAAVVELRADGVVGGAVIKTLDLPTGLHSPNFRGLPYANGLYAKVVSGTGTYVVLYRNDA